MTLGLVGEGAAADAVTAALGDGGHDPADIRPGDVGAVDVAVVVDEPGAAAFAETNEAALASGTPWLAVELGGVGGYRLPDVAASVAGFSPETGCYDCLRGRVAANADETSDAGSGTEPPDARFAGALAGREAVRALDGEGAVFGRVLEVPHAERRFLPLPDCDCAGERDRTLDLSHEPRSLDDTAAAAEGALDGRVGVVREIGEAESFPVPYYLARLCETGGFSDATAPPQAAGVAVDWNAAFVKALGESMERYCAGVYRTAAFAHGPGESIEHPVPPSAFVTSPAFDAPAPDDELAWVPGQDLRGGERVHLPAPFVQFPPPEPRYRPGNTTGLGLGNGSVEAVLSGLYETIERDAAIIAWYSTFEPLELTVEDEGYRTLVRRARAEGLSVTALLCTQDVDVPVVVAAVHREGDWPRFATGMGADLDPATAARSALEEALQNWTELRGMGPGAAADENGAIGYYAELPDTAREFVDAGATVPAESVGPDEVPEGEAELEAVLDRLATADLDAHAARLTPPDVAGLGFEAARVLVPSAQPLFTDESYFGERAETVPVALGFEPRLDREHHPYP